MKRLFSVCILVLVLAGVLFIPSFAYGQNSHSKIPVLVDGLPIAFDVEPIIESGRTLVPFRAVAEALNVEVGWDGNKKIVSAVHDGVTVKLQIDNKVAYVNDVVVTLDVPPVIKNGRTLIPLRFFSESYECDVLWDAPNNTVRIISPPREMSVIGFYALGDKQTSSWTNLFGKPYPETRDGNTDAVGDLALGWYSLDRDGNLLTASRTGWQRPDGWEHVLEAAERYGIKSEMVVHVTDGDYTLKSLLSDQYAISRAIDELMGEAILYQGINLDFEGLGYGNDETQLKKTRESFNNFVDLLGERTKAEGLKLTLTIHPPNSAYKGYDYNYLGKIADRIVVMAYEYGAKPEPNFLVIQAIEQSLQDVSKEKLVLGISVPSENSQSFLAKIGIAKKYQLGGIALWRLGLLTDEMWDQVRNSIEVK